MKVWDNNLTYSLESDQKDMILLWYLRYPYSKKFEMSKAQEMMILFWGDYERINHETLVIITL